MSPMDSLLLLSFLTLLSMLAFGRTSLVGTISVALYVLQGYSLWQMLPTLMDGGSVLAEQIHFNVFGWPIYWQMSGLGWFFGVITVGAAFFSSWFASGEWGEQCNNPWAFHVTLAANVFAMMLLLGSSDLLTLFIGWELVTWAGYIMMVQAGGAARAAAYRYLIYAVAGGLAVLAAVVLIHVRFGVLEFSAVRAALVDAPVTTQWFLMGLFGAGFGIKMALLPFHRWQAEAYGESPGPAAAFLGAISSRMGLFGLLVVLIQLFGIERLGDLVVPLFGIESRTLWMWLAAFTIVIPTFIALKQNDARMLLAWHGIGQGGYMILGILVATPLGVSGGLMHVFNYASYQAVLFLAVAAVVHRTGTANLDRLGGLINRMPLSYTAMLFGIIGLAGLPPMNGFVSKWFIYKSLLDEGMPLLFVMTVLGTLGTILSVYKLIHNIFLGQIRAEHLEVKEVPWSMSLPMLGLSLLIFVTGFMPGLVLDGVAIAQQALGFAPLEYHLGGVETATGNLNMLAVVGVLLVGIAIGAVIFLLGNPSYRTDQLDNYAGGHFLTAETRYHYSHHFYAGLLRVIGPWYITIIKRTEQGISEMTNTLSAASEGVYRTAYTPILMLVATVIGLVWVIF